MGRKVKERAFEEDGQAEAVRLPSNAEVAKYHDRIMELREKRRKDNASWGVKIRDAFEDASNAGVDVKILKLNIKLAEMSLTEDDKRMSNIYFDKTGQGAFFFTDDKEAEAA